MIHSVQDERPASRLVSTSGTLVPLIGVALSGRVLGAQARLVLRQRYRNDEAQPIEAVYTFPVPSDAALVGFAMETAGRRVEATIQEREAAFRFYDDAISAGHGAALLDEERRNVFTASVGNLLPAEETTIEVGLVLPCAADEGALRLMIPTLVAPRYIPGAPSGDRSAAGVVGPTDRVPDADRITPAIGAVDYGLTVDLVLDLGAAITVESPSHAVTVSDVGAHGRRVTLRQREVPLDRDLVLVASGAPGVLAGVIAERRAGAPGTFALTVVPDLFDPDQRPRSRDVVFVVDVSGSMEGDSLREARAALRLCLRHLAQGDRFQIIAFSDDVYPHAPGLVPFDQRTLAAADAWIQALQSLGGTELLAPLLLAADELAASAGRDRIIVLLTDGQVGNEAEIATQVVAHAVRTRLYTFGIGTSVSDLLLQDLARRTGGAVELIHPGERIDEKVTAQFARATAARVEHLTLQVSGIDVEDLSPAEPGDLVDGVPWVVLGRYPRPGAGLAVLHGTLRGQPFRLEVPLELPGRAGQDGLTALWATARIRELEAAEAGLSARRARSLRKRIIALSTEHGVVSSYTSFVLVEKRSGGRRARGVPRTRVVPVSAPAGWAIAGPGPRFERDRSMSYGVAYAPAADADGILPTSASAGSVQFSSRECTCAAPPMGPARFAFAGPEPGPEPPAGDPVTRLFATQLASGLWEGADGTDAGRLEATARALERCADRQVDSAHALYGAQVRKAILALCAVDPAGTDPRARSGLGAALAAAARVASGRRLRDQVSRALAALGLAMASSSEPL